ncbi:uncharacterized protein TNCV_599461 [Trichonephila clavipes]|nr:uncharacterized protein TNCV_599461 [Trichonephila clavipes]
MITNFFIPELNNQDVQELWFQQDGATCHTARATIGLLKDTFGDRLISRFGPVNWPPRSCDLTPLDYFLESLCGDDEEESNDEEYNSKYDSSTEMDPAARGLLGTDLVILNHGQVTKTTPELAPFSPSFHTISMGGCLSHYRFNVHRPPLRGGSSTASGSNL